MTTNKIDNDWLMVEHYKKENKPFGCILCLKTHHIKDCPHKEHKEEDKSKQAFYYNQDSWSNTYDEESYGY